QINFRLRDAAFSRQRYWGEPFPVYYKDDTPYLLDETKLPLELPKIDSYKPTEDGEPPLARAENWKSDDGHALETDTMPGYAGSCWYFLRYMDPNNENEFVSKEAENYWNQVDLYIGGAEHATGHLLYSRFWNQFLFDLGLVSNKEPFQKLVNQGMIQGRSNFVYRVKDSNKFVSHGLKKEHNTTAIHVDVNMVDNDILNIEKFKTWKSEFNDAEFILDDGKYVCGVEVEKMSKSKWNVVSPDDIIDKYGADTLRMYEMFLGPLEDSKPWNTHGIEGVHKFLRRLWRLFYDEQRTLLITDDAPNEDELKTLHKTIKKIEDDNEKLSFNTSISAFMICVNELTDLKCYKKPILSDLITCLSLFAPYISEELWQVLGNNESITKAKFPEWNNDFIKEDSFECPVSVNGKVRAKINIPIDLTQEQVQERVMDLETVQKWMEGKELKKFIYVPKRIVNIVTNV
ncbi:class I tRNA ligase family protein, partial [Sphingobacteriaceae bacterium AH-315-L07]|nr:class I tRNA ligase family protein [Sphingobacteriaceae bacterium AH-315-L07]